MFKDLVDRLLEVLSKPLQVKHLFYSAQIRLSTDIPVLKSQQLICVYNPSGATLV